MLDGLLDWQGWGRWSQEIRTGSTILLILAGTFAARFLLRRGVRRFFGTLMARAATTEESRRIETLGRVFGHALSLIVFAVGVMLVLNNLGVSIAPILGAAGVVGIAVGFGAQSLVKDFFTGFFMLIENQIRVGDAVEIAGKTGIVESMTLRRVKLRSYDGSVHYVSNGLITTVTNMSTEFAYAVMDVGVAYRENIDRVYEVIRDTARRMRETSPLAPSILDDVEIAGVDQWGESAVVIRCRIKAVPLDQWKVRREFLKQLKDRFDAEGISIPFPHRTVVHEPAEAPPAPARAPGRTGGRDDSTD